MFDSTHFNPSVKLIQTFLICCLMLSWHFNAGGDKTRRQFRKCSSRRRRENVNQACLNSCTKLWINWLLLISFLAAISDFHLHAAYYGMQVHTFLSIRLTVTLSVLEYWCIVMISILIDCLPIKVLIFEYVCNYHQLSLIFKLLFLYIDIYISYNVYNYFFIRYIHYVCGVSNVCSCNPGNFHTVWLNKVYFISSHLNTFRVGAVI